MFFFYDYKMMIILSIIFIIVCILIYYMFFYKSKENFEMNQVKNIDKNKFINDITAILKILKIIANYRDSVYNATDNETVMLRGKAAIIFDLIMGKKVSSADLNKINTNPTIQQQIVGFIKENKNQIIGTASTYDMQSTFVEEQLKQLVN